MFQSEEKYINWLFNEKVDERFRVVLETSRGEKFRLDDMVRVFEGADHPNLGIIQTLAKIISITNIYTIDDDVIKYNIEKIDFIYCLLCDIIGKDRMNDELNRIGELVKTLLLGDDNMHFEVLKVSDEEFDKHMDSFHMIEIEDVDVEECSYFKTTEEILKELEKIFGDLNVFKEVREFNKRYEKYKHTRKDLYEQMLIDEVLFSDEIISKPLKIVRYIENDYCETDRGTQYLSCVIGYNLIY